VRDFRWSESAIQVVDGAGEVECTGADNIVVTIEVEGGIPGLQNLALCHCNGPADSGSDSDFVPNVILYCCLSSDMAFVEGCCRSHSTS